MKPLKAVIHLLPHWCCSDNRKFRISSGSINVSLDKSTEDSIWSVWEGQSKKKSHWNTSNASRAIDFYVKTLFNFTFIDERESVDCNSMQSWIFTQENTVFPKIRCSMITFYQNSIAKNIQKREMLENARGTNKKPNLKQMKKCTKSKINWMETNSRNLLN